MFEKIKGYYDSGLWSEERVKKMVDINVITKKQYEEITGEKHKA